LLDLMNRARHAEAESAARAVLLRHPNAGMAWRVLAFASMLQGKDALMALQKASELLPEDAELHNYLGIALQDRGQLASAESCYRRALLLQPQYAEAQDNLGSVLRELGRLSESVSSHRQALSINPGSPEVLNNLGLALQAQGELEAAEANYREALKFRPRYAEALGNLANVLRDAGQIQEALVLYRKAMQSEPGLAEAHDNLGSALLQVGQREEALASYRQALAIKPAYAEAHLHLGNALRDLGRLSESVDSYRHALRLKPEYTLAYRNLGNVLIDLARVDEAEVCFRKALELKPDYAEVYSAMAIVLRKLDRLSEAEASCCKALELNSQLAPALSLLGEIRTDQGRFDEAEQLFRQAIAVDPELPEAWANLARYRHMSEQDAAWLGTAQRLVAKPLPVRHLINLNYAIGKYFDDLGNYAQAFASYHSANELTKTLGARYTPQHHTQFIDQLIRTQSRSSFEEPRQPVSTPERAVFIIGMPRSGTTLAEQILASHPMVFGAGELPFWMEAARKIGPLRPGSLGLRENLAIQAAAYAEMLSDLAPDAQRVIDKMPANFINVGLIHRALPQARFIHMRRHPIDTCLSVYFQPFVATHAYANDLENLAHYYREYSRLMAHWRAVLPAGVMLEVPYESLVEEPEAWTRKMLEWIALPWDPACLAFHETRRTVTTASKWQVRQRLSKGSVGRWRHYEAFVDPLRHLLALEAQTSG